MIRDVLCFQYRRFCTSPVARLQIASSLLSRSEQTAFDGLRHGRAYRVQIYVGSTGQKCRLVQKAHGPVASLPELADFLIFTVGTLRNVLAEQSHPPGNVTEPTSDDCELILVVHDAVHFEFGWFCGLPIYVAANRAQHQPAPSDLGVTPYFHDIRTRTQHQVHVVAHDRLAKQVDAKVAGL